MVFILLTNICTYFNIFITTPTLSCKISRAIVSAKTLNTNQHVSNLHTYVTFNEWRTDISMRSKHFL